MLKNFIRKIVGFEIRYVDKSYRLRMILKKSSKNCATVEIDSFTFYAISNEIPFSKID